MEWLRWNLQALKGNLHSKINVHINCTSLIIQHVQKVKNEATGTKSRNVIYKYQLHKTSLFRQETLSIVQLRYGAKLSLYKIHHTLSVFFQQQIINMSKCNNNQVWKLPFIMQSYLSTICLQIVTYNQHFTFRGLLLSAGKFRFLSSIANCFVHD